VKVETEYELLTADEAVRFLRLDTLGLKKPSDTLRRYIVKGELHPTRISGHNFYSREALRKFIAARTETSY